MQDGQIYMDEIRKVLRRLDSDERKILAMRADLQKLADRNSNYFLLLLTLVPLVFLLVFFRLLYLELRASPFSDHAGAKINRTRTRQF
jgi:CHASE3 domain sensor protein